MPGMYPDDQVVEIFGEQVKYPGLDPDTHKFTDGDFHDPIKKPSYIPAETVNLILDNLSALLVELGKTPNNESTSQLALAFKAVLDLKAPLASPVFTGTPQVPEKTSAATDDGTLIATEAQVKTVVDSFAQKAPANVTLSTPIADGTPPAEITTATEITSLLQTIWNKLAYLFSVRFNLQYYNSGASWYIKFPNGFILQGGAIPNTSATFFSFPVAMANTNYIIVTQGIIVGADSHAGGWNTHSGVSNLSTTGGRVSVYAGDSRITRYLVFGLAA